MNDFGQQSNCRDRINFIVGKEKMVFNTSLRKARLVSPAYLSWVDGAIARSEAENPPPIPAIIMPGLHPGFFKHIHLYIENKVVNFGPVRPINEEHVATCQCGFVGLWDTDQIHDTAIVTCNLRQHDPTELLFAIVHAHTYQIHGFVSMAAEKLLAAATSAFANNIQRIVPTILRFERGLNTPECELQGFTLEKVAQERMGSRFEARGFKLAGTPRSEIGLRYASVLGPYETIVS